MQVSVEKINSVKRKVKITVPVDEIQAEYNKQINELAKNANIKGFRPGKAPLSIIKQRYNNEAKSETIYRVINTTLTQALAQENLQPINTPQIEPESVDFEKPFEFSASFEILPEIDDVKITLPSIEKLNVEITSNDIEQVITHLQRQYTDWTLVEREVKDKDRAVIDYTIYQSNEDTEGVKNQNAPVEIGSGTMLPGFEEGLVGMKAGESKRLSLVYPEQYPDTERAGKPFEVAVEVKQVFEGTMPALDEKFIANLGVTSGKIEDLQKQVRQSLEMERTRLVKDHLKNQVFKALLDQNPIEVPGAFIDMEAHKIHNEIYPHHEHNKEHHHSKEEMESFREIAKSRVSLSLILTNYITKQSIKLDPERFTSRIDEIASIYEDTDAVKKWLLTDEKKKDIEAQVLEEQALDKIIEGIPVVEKTMAYSELKGIDSAQSA